MPMPMPITSIENGTFSNFRFQFISIAHTNVEKIHARAFESSFNYTTSLSLRSNKLKNNYLDPEYNTFVVINKFKQLRHLILADNQLGHIPTYAFSNLKYLLAVRLERNHIQTLGAYAFYLAPKLMSINLEGNKLTAIDNHAIAMQSSKWPLELNFQFNHINSDAIHGLASASRTLDLKLNNNNVTTLSRATFEPLFSHFPFSRLDIRSNPFNCNCGTRWFYQNRTFYQSRIEVKCDGVSIWDIEQGTLDLRDC